MTRNHTALLVPLLVPALAGCAMETARHDARAITRELREVAPPAPDENGELDDALATGPALADVLRVALAQNPELRRARAEANARIARLPAAAALPDPELTYELRSVPLGDPLALDMAQEHMLTLAQTLPAPGSLGARGAQAAADARISVEALRAADRDVSARVMGAWAELYEASHELEIRDRHLALARDVVALTRARYHADRNGQTDTLRAMVAAASAENDRVNAGARVERSRALLNTLMGRNPAAPLGTPPAPDLAAFAVPADVAALAEREAPLVRSAGQLVERAEAALKAERSEARWPAFMLGATYSNMPMNEEPHGWGAMVGLSLPWLGGGHGARVDAAEAELSASRRGLEAVRNEVRYAVAEATARVEAARASLSLLDRELLPAAERSFDSARAAYSGGSGDALSLLDALRSLLEVRLETVRAGTRVIAAVADLERSAGSFAALPSRATGAGTGAGAANEGATR